MNRHGNEKIFVPEREKLASEFPPEPALFLSLPVLEKNVLSIPVDTTTEAVKVPGSNIFATPVLVFEISDFGKTEYRANVVGVHLPAQFAGPIDSIKVKKLCTMVREGSQEAQLSAFSVAESNPLRIVGHLLFQTSMLSRL